MNKLYAVLMLLFCTSVIFAVDGTVAGKIGEINRATGEIVINTGENKYRIEMGDKLYVRINGDPVIMKATFPMLTVIKCRLDSGYTSNLKDIEKGMTVYKYSPGIEKKEDISPAEVKDRAGRRGSAGNDAAHPSIYHDTIWKIVCPGGDPENYYVTFRADGNLGYSYKDADSIQFDNTDTWHVEGGRLVIIWTNGYSTEQFEINPESTIFSGKKNSKNYEGEMNCTIEKVR